MPTRIWTPRRRERTNRSAYLETQENSIVNILSSPLYTSSNSGGLGALILSPEDVEAHGWIVSDTGFDGNIDPIAGISGRAWLGDNSESVAAGYRNAIATGKVRLFYGLNADEQSRHSASNGCQGVEGSCMGTPYSLRVKNAQGRYIDVEGTFVSTYGFAAYVMAWERMAEDTHISEVFAMGDACTVDLGDEGADADTGLGRLDIGCLARRAYESQVPPPTVPTTPTTVVVTAPTVDVVKPKPVVATVSPEPAIEEEPVAVTVAVVDPAPTVDVVEPAPVITSVSLPVVDEIPTDLEKITYWDRDIDTETLTNEFKRLGLATVTANRKASSYMISHISKHEFWHNWWLIRHKKIPLYQYNRHVTELDNYYLLRAAHNFAAVGSRKFMPSMGLLENSSYTQITVGVNVPLGTTFCNYDCGYRKTKENSLVHFEINPFYLGGQLGVYLPKPTSGLRSTGWGKQIWLDSDFVEDYGWIVSETGFAGPHLGDYRKLKVAQIAQIKENYEKALATGKVRLFYGLNEEQTGRASVFLDCTDFEEYCMGVPHGYNSHYGFGVYLMAWERMPEEAHISAVFAMGDRCTEDLGAAGPDADTGLGRLDIGCMAYEVYKVNLDPTSATLSFRPAQERAYLIRRGEMQKTKDFLDGAGLAEGSYTFRDTKDDLERDPETKTTTRTEYLLTPENSIVHIVSSPLFVTRALAGFAIFPDDLASHGWILADNGTEGNINPIIGISKQQWLRGHSKEVAAAYRQGLATGKVRLIYDLNADMLTRRADMNGCRGVESFCIGAPNRVSVKNSDGVVSQKYGFGATYAFAAYVSAWERLPEETHISAVFAMGDRCAKDLGVPGPDADTGLGRLDIGCMTQEVYKVNLDPTSATLSVAARTRSSATLAGSSLLSVQDGNVQLQGQSAPPAFVGANDDPARQQFF